MTSQITRRTALPILGAMGLAALAPPASSHASRDNESQQQAATFAGTWTYRGFLSNPDINVGFDKLEFASATLIIDQAPQGVLRGRLTFDSDFLALKGNVSYGNPFTMRFQGRGATPATQGWIYDYLGFLVPGWPDGVEQRPAIVGSVIRTAPHSDGKAKAGVVASFVAVKRDS